MKKFISIFCLMLFCLFTISGCAVSNTSDYIRIHIRANSNEEIDQAVKLKVRDEVVNELTPLLANCNTKNEAYHTIQNNLGLLQQVADDCLSENGFDYTASISLKKERFPTRKYLDYTFPSGIYDALIIELGTGKGDNWWCVAFPPLCFIPTDNDTQNFQYKSKLLEIIRHYKEVNNEQKES